MCLNKERLVVNDPKEYLVLAALLNEVLSQGPFMAEQARRTLATLRNSWTKRKNS